MTKSTVDELAVVEQDEIFVSNLAKLAGLIKRECL